MALDLLGQVWPELHGPPASLERVRVGGCPGPDLGSSVPVADLAVGSAAALLLAACELRADLAGAPAARRDPVAVDAAHVGVEFASERHLRVDGEPRPGGFAPLSRFWPAADGWVRVHANYPHHRAALLRALGVDDDDEVPAALTHRTAEDVEEAVVTAGGVAAAVRTPQAWAASPMGAAVAGEPMVRLSRVGPGAAVGAGRGAPGVSGARVLDLTRVIAGPTATRALAAHGADVLRLDPPALAELDEAWLETGPGKRCAPLDLAAPGGAARLEELLGTADVLVHGYRPGALERFGLDETSLAERHPHLVVASLSAWGRHGPWGGRRGFDSLVQAASGIAVMTGAADGRPGQLRVQALDHAAGQLLAAAVLQGLRLRRPPRPGHDGPDDRPGDDGPGGTWHAHVSLAGLAHWLLRRTVLPPGDEPPAGPVPQDPDLRRYLVDVPSSRGRLTVVRPLGAPPWGRGPEPSAPTWLPR